MIRITKKSDCSGCHACVGACPKQCIEMTIDNEGFLYPEVDKSVCVDCGLCEKACQAINPIKSKNTPTAYACYNTNDEIRMQSSSGGVFTLLAEMIIDKGGAVFGAAFDDDLNVCHICVESKEALRKLRGSKYLQSIIGNTYKEAKILLDKGRYVLFTGTPCQIDGLLHYLNKEYDKLYTQDIICHGVPSPMVWHRYLEYQKSAFGGEIDRETPPSFRRKDEGWRRYSLSLCFTGSDKEYRQTLDKDLYMKAFLSNICLRPSCYSCHSKTLNRNSDITLADFWSIEKVLPDFSDDKGISLVMVNSKKGALLFDEIRNNLCFKEADINETIKYNSSVYKSVAMPKRRNRFLGKVNGADFGILVKKYTKVSFTTKVKIKCKIELKKLLRL